jgi:hypothetical protein
MCLNWNNKNPKPTEIFTVMGAIFGSITCAWTKTTQIQSNLIEWPFGQVTVHFPCSTISPYPIKSDWMTFWASHCALSLQYSLPLSHQIWFNKTMKEPKQIMVANSSHRAQQHTYMEIKKPGWLILNKTKKEPTQIMVANSNSRAQQHTYMEMYLHTFWAVHSPLSPQHFFRTCYHFQISCCIPLSLPNIPQNLSAFSS